MTRSNYIMALSILALAAIAAPALSYTGSLSTPSEFVGSSPWMTGSTLSWTVNLNQDNTWHYSYDLGVPSAGLSQFILEVSASFTAANIWNSSGTLSGSPAIDSYYARRGNPGMPAPIRGVKFVSTGGPVFTVAFDSDRAPVWGDFYARDATGSIYLCNAGFSSSDTDPSDIPSDGSIAGHLLVPDTYVSVAPVPEMGTLLLGALGLVPIAGFRLIRLR